MFSSLTSSSYQSAKCLIEDYRQNKFRDSCLLDNSSLLDESSHRSHDGVFLRPGAVSTSPPAVRFSKRPSIDSGINIDIRNSSQRSGKGLKDSRSR